MTSPTLSLPSTGGVVVVATAAAASSASLAASALPGTSGDVSGSAVSAMDAQFYTALGFLVEGFIEATYEKEKADDASTSPAKRSSRMATAPAQILLAPGYSARVARSVVDGAETWVVSIGGAFGLNLSEHSCELCGGFFPTQGGAVMYLDPTGHPLYLHEGCWRNVEDWVPQPHEVGA